MLLLLLLLLFLCLFACAAAVAVSVLLLLLLLFLLYLLLLLSSLRRSPGGHEVQPLMPSRHTPAPLSMHPVSILQPMQPQR